MGKVYLDCETCGFHGVPVLLQWAYEDDEPQLWNIWSEKIGDTLDLLDFIMQQDVIGFNLAFDWFHICKIYTMFIMYLSNDGDRDDYPDGHVDEMGEIEEQARFLNLCIKPKRAHDVMMWARKTKYQALMERDDIKIAKVPTALAWELSKELEKRIPFDSIYFAKAKDPLAPKWKIYDIERPDGSINPDFKTIKLKFKASSGLKNLYRHAFKVTEEFFTFADIEIDDEYYPDEVGYAPYAKALAPKGTGHWGRTWPFMLKWHLAHWYYNTDARKYAADDVNYTRRLYKEEFESPEPGDVDSTLTCMVAAVRWHGFAIDVDRMKQLKYEDLIVLGFSEELAQVFKHRWVTKDAVTKFGKAVMAAKAAKRYVMAVMVEQERIGFQGSTKRTVLEEIATWQGDDGKLHPAARRAQEVLNARQAKKRIEVYDKLIRAKRFHASFKVIGTLSSRMSGTDGLNAQGINHAKYIRAAFPLADNDLERFACVIGFSVERVRQLIDSGQLQLTYLCGGDFKGFEVSIAAKVFNDEKLNTALRTGTKIHAIFAMELFPGKTYEEVLATDGSKTERDLYDVGKKCLFAIFYGAEAFTLMDRHNLSEEVALKAVEGLQRRFPGIRIFGEKIKNDFAALSQAGGIGTKVEWREPKDYAESFLGFRRYFTLENRVMKHLFNMAQDVPQTWRNLKIKVQRRERIQTPAGATSSALYGAAFGIMSRTIRAAKNHHIQSPGAEITKGTQANIWELQPVGANPWIVQPMNIHDEIMCSTAAGHEKAVEEKAKESVVNYSKEIPLLAIDWFNRIPNWSGKKGDQQPIEEAA